MLLTFGITAKVVEDPANPEALRGFLIEKFLRTSNLIGDLSNQERIKEVVALLKFVKALVEPEWNLAIPSARLPELRATLP